MGVSVIDKSVMAWDEEIRDYVARTDQPLDKCVCRFVFDNGHLYDVPATWSIDDIKRTVEAQKAAVDAMANQEPPRIGDVEFELDQTDFN